ncbi:MAG: fibronectin type III domain-containing protein [Thermoplasmata archaeon]|nr:fibronectin type III domain-containing protein [Thermoplasmata archaeon]
MEETQLLYITATEHQIEMLEKSGVRVIERYPNYALVEVTSQEKKVIEKSRFEVAGVDNTILLQNYRFDPLRGEPMLPRSESDVKLVQFIGPVKASWKTALANLGCEIYWYIPNNAFIVKVPSSSLSLVKKLSFVRWVGEYLPAYKIDGALTGMGEAKVSISLLTPDASDNVAIVVNAYGGELIKTGSTMIVAKLSQAGIRAVSEISGVEFISPYEEMRILNNNAQWITQTGNSGDRKIWDRGIQGEGQIVGETDTGIDYDHAAFRDPNVQIVQNQVNQNHRKIVLYQNFADGKDSDNSGHGTHVAGTIAGDDSYVGGTAAHDGMAYKAKLAFGDIGYGDSLSGIPSDYNNLFGPLYNAGARIISNSWGSSSASYTSSARMVDVFMWNHKDCLILFANGNSGASGAQTVGSPATAKNLVSVGASKNSPNQNDMASFSSRGTTTDGRLKPTISAVGSSLYSADSDGNLNTNNSGYISMAGTSMATPCAAGNAALVRQYFMEGWYPTGAKNPANAFTPSAALLKAVLMVGGVELTGAYSDMNNEGKFPNNSQGWGRINLDNSLYFAGDTLGLQIVDETAGISTGEYKEYQYSISSNAQPFKVILTWTDYPGTVGASKAIVNNLDLKVTAPDGSVYLGNVFSGKNPGHSVTGGSPDTINVEEGVILPTPVTGTYTIRVTATNVPNGPQPFALALIGAIGSGGGDTTPPVISNVEVKNITQDSATITWTTDEPSTSVVEYGKTTSYGQTATGANGVTSHSVTLLGLSASTLYHFRVKSADGAGNTATSSDYTFTTLSPGDTTPPVISNVEVKNITQDSATVTWTTDEPSTSVVEYGTTTSYGQTATGAGGVTSHTVQLSGLTASTLYHFRVKSADAAGNAAVSSDYTFTTSGGGGDTTPPVISNVEVKNITQDSATVTWITDEPSTSVVEYGTDTSYGESADGPDGVTFHTVVLTGLTPSTTYHFRVSSKDASGNTAESDDYTFTTTQADTTPPVISNVAVSGITMTSAIVTWTTDEPSTSVVEYGKTPAYGDVAIGATGVTSHQVTLTGLSPATTYHFRVNSKDAYGNTAVSQDYNFTTASNDTTPPQISNVTVVNITASSAVVMWTTDEPSSSVVEYGTTTSYGQTATGANGVISHSVQLSGLTSSTLYHFRVKSADANGNAAISSDYTFTTSGGGGDTTPPVISNVAVKNITATSAIITWITDEPSSSVVDYGTTTAYGKTETGAGNTTSHSVSLSGLTPGTLYHFMVKSVDASGNAANSSDYTFTTLNNTTVIPLTDGVPETGTLGKAKDVRYYCLVVPAGKIKLKVELRGSAYTDFDLYAKLGTLPTLSIYDYRGVNSNSNELININAPSPGTWYFMVYSYSGKGTFTIKATTTAPPSVTPLTDGVPYTDTINGTGYGKYYSITVGPGRAQLKVELVGSSSYYYKDLDLYVKYNALPTTLTYDYKSTSSSSNEKISILNPAEGIWFIYVFSYYGAGSYTIKATTTDTVDDGQLQDGVAKTSSLSGSGKGEYFYITIPTGKYRLRIDLTGPLNADFDLYVRLNSKPTPCYYDIRSVGPSSYETIIIGYPPAGTWYILVYSYYGSGSFTIKATTY